MTKLKRNKAEKREWKVRTQTDEKKKISLAKKKRVKGKKKDWIVSVVEEVVKRGIKGEEGI